MLSSLVDEVAAARGLDEIYELALDGLEAALGIDRSAFVLLDAHGVTKFVASRGLSAEYRRAAERHFPWPVDATDPPAIAVRDVLGDESLAPLHENLRREKIGAVAFIPLVYAGRLLGKFMLYHRDHHEFTDEELARARTIGRLIAFAIERTRIENSLRQIDRSKDEFLATLAHELRNPLAALAAALDVLELRHGSSVERETAISKRQVQHLGRIIDDLTDVARITLGLVVLQREAVELSQIVTRAIETIQPLLDRLQHQLVVSVPGRRLVGDPVRLEQVFSNLLSNAAKYTPAGGTISVVAINEPEQVIVHVRDTGVGMPPELLPRIFDVFTQGARTLDRAQGGLGIGLTITKQLVALHGGAIEASSAGPGKGSELVVRLPAPRIDEAGERQADEREDTRDATEPRRARVLLVDDNQDLASSLAELVRLWGFSVDVETSGTAALAAVAHDTPDIILLDIGLPEIDGYELARRIRTMPHLANSSLVALSGYAQPADVRRSYEVGFVKHLVKPVNPDVLHRLLTGLASPARTADRPHG